MAAAGEVIPYQSRSSDGSLYGINIDIWRTWAKQNSIDLEIKLVSPEQALNMVRTGQADFASPVPTGYPQEGLQPTKSYLQLPIHIVHHKSVHGVEGVKDLAGFKIGTIPGGLIDSYLRERAPFGATVIEYSDMDELAAAAALGQVSVFLGVPSCARHHLTKMQIAGEYLLSRQPVEIVSLSAVTASGNSGLLAFLDFGLEMLGPDSISRIESRWNDEPASEHLSLRLVGSLLLGLLAVLGLVALWTWQLRLRVRQATLELVQVNASLEEEVDMRRRAQEQALLQKAYFKQLFDNSPQATTILDESGLVVSVNRAFTQLFQYHPDEVLGLRLQDLILPSGRRAALEAREQERTVDRPIDMETVRSQRDGRPVHVHLLSFPILINGRRNGSYRIYQDITKRKTAEDLLIHQAFHDRLTGLPNRALFTDRLEHVMARARRNPDLIFAVLFLDIDRFKVINDSLGHLAGDQLIKNVGEKLTAAVRAQDTVGRLGGDEFVILLEDLTSHTEAETAAERILEEIRQPCHIDGCAIHSTASIGIVIGPTAHDRAEFLLRDADIAMYHAKDQGKDRFMVFTPSMSARAMEVLKIENEMRQALDDGQFEVFYQPVINIKTGQLASFEALLRWRHPELGLISPADFIPIAEETGLIVPIGLCALGEACSQIREWQSRYDMFCDLGVSVNLSARQFNHPALASDISRVTAASGLDFRCLKLEITESVVMENARAAERLLRELKDLDVQIAIDDFGTGYSSLSYLHLFPIDTIKVDRSFVSRMHAGGRHSEIVKTIIILAHGLGMDVVAEGVEQEAQLETLKELGSDFVQGFYFSRPLPAAEASMLLARLACGMPLPAQAA